MENLLIIMPVKNALNTAEPAIERICNSKANAEFLVYNDLSTPENTQLLHDWQSKGFQLINLSDMVSTPSPNYRHTLRDARRRALENNGGLLIIESDVFVEHDTIERLVNYARTLENCGMVAAITCDKEGQINFPYLHITPDGREVLPTSKRLSFCCTLLTNQLLQKLDFDSLSEKKDWFDVQISRDSREMGFTNYVVPALKVLHLPHSSRPWKQLKYSNPVLYYFKKFFLRRDRI